MFEALRETIYAEVATLISQNESRPHFLIEVFRELQQLNSDYLRQRGLYAIQDLLAKYLREEGEEQQGEGRAPGDMRETGSAKPVVSVNIQLMALLQVDIRRLGRA